MVAPISALANMEMALYGGMGMNASAPSYLNGYRGGLAAADSMMSYPMFPNYGNMSGYSNPAAAQTSAESAAGGQNPSVSTSQQNKAELNTLVNYYKKNSILEEGFAGALTGGLTFTAMENPQTLAHPFNAVKAAGETEKTFKGIFEAVPSAKELWKTENTLMRDAYSQLYRVNRNAKSKWAVSKWFIKPMEESERASLEKIMTDALKSGDKKQIEIATEQLRAASKCNGRIPNAFNWIKSKFTGKEAVSKTPTQLAKEALSNGTVEKAITEKGLTFAKHALKEGKGWFLFDMILNSGKIFTAFTAENGGFESGMKQTGQSAFKAAGNALGWVAGKAAGGWAAAKLGAMIGSAFPGVGTTVGAVVGFIGGSVGMWAMGKLTNWIAGVDEATNLEAKSLTKTPEGQAQLISMVAQKIQAGEKVPEKVLNAAQIVAAA